MREGEGERHKERVIERTKYNVRERERETEREKERETERQRERERIFIFLNFQLNYFDIKIENISHLPTFSLLIIGWQA